jgi:hypothetical protein
LPTFPGIETSETAEIPDPIMPKATRNHGEALSPSKNVVSCTCRDAIWEITIRIEKYNRMIINNSRGPIIQ